MYYSCYTLLIFKYISFFLINHQRAFNLYIYNINILPKVLVFLLNSIVILQNNGVNHVVDVVSYCNFVFASSCEARGKIIFSCIRFYQQIATLHFVTLAMMCRRAVSLLRSNLSTIIFLYLWGCASRTARFISRTASIRSQTTSIRSQTASIRSQTASIINHTASIRSKTASIINHTASIRSKTASIRSHTASIINHTASIRSKTASIISKTANIISQTVSITNQTASIRSQTANIISKTARFISRTASIISQTASIRSQTARFIDTIKKRF